MSTIVAQALTKHYGSRVGVDDVTFSVGEGVVFGFLGPNGSGKTTTIRVLLGLLHPTRGTARMFGCDCWNDSAAIKADVGYLPGDVRLYPWLTGNEALRIFGAVRGLDLSRSGRRLAELFDLDLQLRVRRMSRGTRQKLGLIVALAHEPKVLILDEPTVALDPLTRERLQTHLRTLADRGHTVFFSSHTLSEVQQLCDQVVILREGRVVADTTLEQLRSQAGRSVTIVWRANAGAETMSAPPCLRVDRRRGRQWECALNGSAMDLIRWACDAPIEDITIGQPDLESVFRRFYLKERGDR